jgi:hypothetical protein
MSMRAISLSMDIVLILMAVGIVLYMRGMGGIIGKSLGTMTAGIVILGLAHILETLTYEVFRWDTDFVEVTHRIVVMLGFAFVFLGFRRIAQLR